MRRSIPAGVLMVLAFLIPAAPAAAAVAAAQTGPSTPTNACQTGERKVYTDLRRLVTIDLDTASNTEVRVLANQLLAAAIANSLPLLPGRLQERLDGSAEDLRAFLKTGMQGVWTTDLRISVGRTMTAGGPHGKAAAQAALDADAIDAIDALLAYLNDGLYVARALDCASEPAPSASASQSRSPSPSEAAPVSASASVSPAAAPAALARTGANTSFLALGGAALVLFGMGVVLVARRFRT